MSEMEPRPMLVMADKGSMGYKVDILYFLLVVWNFIFKPNRCYVNYVM